MNLQHISYAEPDDPLLKRRFIRGVEYLTGRPGFLRRYAATYLDWLERVYGKTDRVWFDALERLGGQVFLTGADPAAFAELEGRAEMFEVSAERGVRPRAA